MALLKKMESGPEILSTVSTYLLDANSSTAQTAKMLCCHLNTVKYRLRVAKDLLGYSPSEMPDAFPLYMAVAINRIQGNKN